MPTPSPLEGLDEFEPAWDVARDTHGDPITITEEQLHAIWRACDVVEQVRRQEGERSMWSTGSNADVYKSRLLGRMVLQGLPPTRTKPPLEMGGPAWWRLPGGDPFAVVNQESPQQRDRRRRDSAAVAAAQLGLTDVERHALHLPNPGEVGGSASDAAEARVRQRTRPESRPAEGTKVIVERWPGRSAPFGGSKLPTRLEVEPEYGFGGPETVWYVADGDVWQVRCMDCGVGIGTVNAGNGKGALKLTRDHNEKLHQR